MSLKAMLWVMEDAPVTDPIALLILYALADRANDDGTAAWPSQAWIADRARCSIRTVRRKLEDLEDEGIIRRGDHRLVAHLRGDRRPFVWDINLDAQPATGGQAVRPSDNAQPATGGHPCPGGQSDRADTPGTTGGQDRPNGRTAVSDKPSKTPHEPSKGGGVTSELTAAREKEIAPFVEPWIHDPSMARCALHLGVVNPPPCHECRILREAAEGARDRRRQRALDERASCPNCDEAGWILDLVPAAKCPHEPGRVAAIRSEVAASAPQATQKRLAGPRRHTGAENAPQAHTGPKRAAA